MTKKFSKSEIIDPNGTVTKQYKIQYNEIGTTFHLKPQRAAELCQDTAVMHSDLAGYSLDFFRKNCCGWVLTSWHLVFSSLPRENEDISITTWARPYKRLQADRSFKAVDKDGVEYFRAMSRWFLFDTTKRKPKRLPEGFFEKYIISPLPLAIEGEDFSQTNPALFTPKKTRIFEVTRRDLDSNFHTNNIAYFDWAFDDIDDELFVKYNIRDLYATYVKETTKCDKIKSRYLSRAIDGKTIEVTSIFSDPDDDEAIFARISSVWVLKK